MAKAITKLFRDPKDAEKAFKELLKCGFDARDIGILMLQGEGFRRLQSALKGIASERTSLPDIGTVIGIGPIASAIQQSDPGNALIQALNITPEAYEYYRFGILVGGILVSVHDSEERLIKAQAVLRASVPKPKVMETGARSPGFAVADRMNATNPMDAPMSGDFRKY